MIKKYFKTMLLTSMIILIPMFIGLYLWNELPDIMATHWNMSGDVDGWTPKSVAVIGVPIFMLLVQWLGFIMMTNTDSENKMIYLVLWICPIISLLMGFVVYSYALGYNVNVGKIVLLTLGCMFVVIGNYLPKQTQNLFIGIRLPWTLKDEENWRKTHRFSGWTWMISGIVMVICGIFELYWISISFIIAIIVFPVCYSYYLYQKE